jgi:hypothetical protein
VSARTSFADFNMKAGTSESTQRETCGRPAAYGWPGPSHASVIVGEQVRGAVEQVPLPGRHVVGVHVVLRPNSSAVLSPRTAAKATLALNAAPHTGRSLVPLRTS